MSFGAGLFPALAPLRQASGQSLVIAQSLRMTPRNPYLFSQQLVQQLIIKTGSHLLQRLSINRHALQDRISWHHSANLCSECAGERNQMLREVVSGKLSVAAVVIVAIPAVFRGSITRPVLHHRDHTAGVQAIRTVLQPRDIRFDHALRDLGIFAESSVDARPPRFRGQIGLRRERLANTNRFILLADNISETASQLRIIERCKAQRLRPHRECVVLCGCSQHLLKVVSRIGRNDHWNP